MLHLVLGGLVVALAATLAGATGFGFGLVSVPLLLLVGYSLPFVVSVNLTLALLTRVSVVYQLRAYLTPRRALSLVLGSVPGLWLGALVLTSVSPHWIKLATGLLVILATLLLVRARHAPPPRPIPGSLPAVGFIGGFLGATTALNGIPVVLLLARDRIKPLSLLVDLAAYFVLSNLIALGLLEARGALVHRALFPAALFWLPGALAGTYLGVLVSRRLPEVHFRWLTIALAIVSGAITVLTA